MQNEGLLVELIFPRQGQKNGCGVRLYERPVCSADKCRQVLEVRSEITEPEEFLKLLSCCLSLRAPSRPVPISG